MTRFLTLLVVVLILAVAPALTAADNVTGTWNCVAKSPGRPDMEFQLDLKQDGKQVSGTGSRADGSASIQQGSFENGKLKLQIDADNGTYEFEATLTGNKLSGSLTHPSRGKATWEGTREAAAGASKASASPIEGVWKMEHYNLEFKQEGGKLIGSVIMSDGQVVPLTKITFADSVLRFTATSPDGSYEAEAKLDGDKLVGTYSTPSGAKRTWEAKRL